MLRFAYALRNAPLRGAASSCNRWDVETWHDAAVRRTAGRSGAEMVWLTWDRGAVIFRGVTGSAKRLNLVTRSLGAGLLVLWMNALILCWVHCTSGGCVQQIHAKNSQPSCHGGGKSEHSKSSGSNSNECLAKEPASAMIDSPRIPSFTEVFLFALPTVYSVEPPTATGPAFSRRSQWDIWVFNPEVCLGPGIRTHAPPVS